MATRSAIPSLCSRRGQRPPAPCSSNGLPICGVAILVAFFKTLTVLALASRAFAFYYTLQCLVAFNVSKSPVQKCGILLVAAALGFITLFAVPAG